MGYTTEFTGAFLLDRPLSLEQANYLREFSNTRRMWRSPEKMSGYADPLREAVGLPLGKDGEFYVGSGDKNSGQWPPPTESNSLPVSCGQLRSADVVDYNKPPKTQPGLWCQWVPTKDNTGIVWDGGEKFYNYCEWLQYLIDNFLRPWGYTLHGEVDYQGEDIQDAGRIRVKNNSIVILKKKVTYEEDTTLTLTKDQLLVVWTALQQFVDNADDTGEGSPREAQATEIAQKLIDDIDARIAAQALAERKSTTPAK